MVYENSIITHETELDFLLKSEYYCGKSNFNTNLNDSKKKWNESRL